MAFGAITPWLFPQVAKRQENEEEVKGLYLNVRNSSIVLSTFILACFCLISGPLIHIWLGEEMYLNTLEIVNWFCVFEFFFLLSITPNFYLNASGMEKFNLKMVLTYTGLNAIALSMAYAMGTEIWHFVFALAISTILGMLIFHYFLNKRIKVYKLGQIILILLPALIGSGVALSNTTEMKLVFFILCLLSLYLIFFKVYKTNIKKIFGD
jgi:O-antigen/teichoic acid export membrane protein